MALLKYLKKEDCSLPDLCRLLLSQVPSSFIAVANKEGIYCASIHVLSLYVGVDVN